MNGEKDRLGDKLHDLEKAREDEYFAKRDRELLEKLRQKKAELSDAASQAAAALGMLCPRCHKTLVEKSEAGVKLLACPAEEGAWLDAAELKTVVKSRQ